MLSLISEPFLKKLATLTSMPTLGIPVKPITIKANPNKRDLIGELTNKWLI